MKFSGSGCSQPVGLADNRQEQMQSIWTGGNRKVSALATPSKTLGSDSEPVMGPIIMSSANGRQTIL